jgi:Methyltransferase domain
MAVVRITDPVEHYRALASCPDISGLSGHDLGSLVSEFVNARIIAALDPTENDVLLDIGCGDGSLLKSSSERVGKRIGVVPTIEEQARLQAAHANISFLVGLVQKLPLESGIATKVVCNSVLLLLGSEKEVIVAVNEISRVSKAGAKIWIGEIPGEDERAHFKVYSGRSVVGFFWHQLRHKGLHAFVRTFSAAFRGRLEIASFPLFHCLPEAFVKLIESCGLEICWHTKHQRPDAFGNLIESAFRYDYLVRKPLPSDPLAAITSDLFRRCN